MKKILIVLLSVLCVSAYSQQKANINVGSFNLRMDTESDKENAWPNRKEMVKSLLLYHEFDIFGTQEGFKHQLDGILETGKYAYIGGGRDDGKDAGEHSAIIYNKERFKVLDNGDFWYSETPDVPGKGWDAECCNRICSWGKFKDNVSGKEFFFFNSHYDHQGKVARRESSKLLLKKMKEIVGSSTFFCTGDFNATPDDEPIQILYADGMFNDSRKITKQPPYGPEGTFSAYKFDAPMKNRIDYIFVSADVTVNKYAVLTDSKFGRYASDHFPVLINATF
ncbi:endonuclease/exonuclease/phosphatase family protein [Massilibacteroides vaginae]|uniref:endonuclease/exonuclease/phosphatase family protein n=1 Tax=Massilibacteroides vaginae TaxID=1673718 RepID=UPI000A1CD021|nr:endonuclease/exonuclease/phosphatase family protein [Massilibacteroides vaginae]